MELTGGNSTSYIIVWNESGSANVTVNLGAAASSVQVYDPTQGTAATQTLSNASSVSLALTDHPMIIEVGGTGSTTMSEGGLSYTAPARRVSATC